MAKTFSSVPEYLAAQPPEVRAPLSRVRAAIRKALPNANEVISYQIPAYKLDGRIVVYFAGWKDHYSIYPVTPAMAAAFGAELEPYSMSGKGTIRFPLMSRIPVGLISRIAKFRAREVTKAALARKAKRR